MTSDTLTPRVDERTSDQRWAAWVAKGAEHDKKTTTRIVAIAVAVTGLIAAAVLLLG
jgi:hypothetical protein